MKRLFTKLAMMVTAAFLLYPTTLAAQASPTTKKAVRVSITQGPELESANDHLAIIRWRSDNPGGSPEHYGVVHYGANPRSLSETAKSPIRLNPGHSYTIFRVRVDDLKPGTTYYYKVDSMEANGTSDGIKSPIRRFTTAEPRHNDSVMPLR